MLDCSRISLALLSVVACRGPDTDSNDRPDVEDEDQTSGWSSAGAAPDLPNPGSTGEPEPADPCVESCADIESEAGIAMCHSCRCKVALDDWLPTVEELQCKNAESIITYHAALSDAEYVLEPSTPAATHCANPSLLTGSCRQGSKLGHIRHGDAELYWVCRDPYLEVDGAVVYEDMAVIGHNVRTGATCFWDDVNDVIHDDDAPPIDMLDATEDERARFVALFGYHDGSSCVTCHDHDPFLYTPYLRSTTWDSIAADKGPYHLVGLGREPRATGTQHLISRRANPCTSCHRLGSEGTCTSFAPDAMGQHKRPTYELAVHDAIEPGNQHWELAYWMPNTTAVDPEYADWEATFADARAHILQCCASPGEDVDDCRWAPVPMKR
ncbi:MAG: hypothetical protein JKY37_00600 [Nannocystaceae bacterium]|nr:hypothetical protein [Nannocystaceae bacterium]